MTSRLFLWMATAASLVLPVHVYGQAAQSNLTGTVRDTTGAVLPGVTIEAASPALIAIGEPRFGGGGNRSRATCAAGRASPS